MKRGGLLLFGALLLAAQTAQSPLPNSALSAPAGMKVAYRFQTQPDSVQIYTCRQTGGNFGWAGPDPDAILIDSAKKLTVHHYKGPSWEVADGSGIVRSDGSRAKHYLPANSNAVHWLELPAQDAAGKFAGVTVIHRMDTSGGLPPTLPCDAGHAGDQERVKYAATYVFYAK